jgi:hypothetical protein
MDAGAAAQHLKKTYGIRGTIQKIVPYLRSENCFSPLKESTGCVFA